MKEIVIKGVIAIPKIFYFEKTDSFLTLLVQTGYFQISNSISEKDIFNTLSLFPEYIDDWVLWSENKRVDEGWCFVKKGNEYNVCYAKDDIKIENLIFQNKIEACANFIKKEIDSMRF